MDKNIVIAIDGPSASGKSTVAKMLAERLNYLYIDTGAMYRALALKVMESKVSLTDEKGIFDLLKTLKINLAEKYRVLVNNSDVTELIRGREVTYAVPKVSSPIPVRQYMVELQRLQAKSHNVVMDGRDIGTVVFPKANIKFYQVASVEARATRRHKENMERGIVSSIEDIKKELEERDYIDSNKIYGALKRADDAIVLDTSNMDISEVFMKMLDIVHKKLGV